MHVLRHIDRNQIQMDFLVNTEIPGAYDAEVQSLGSRIWRCPINRTQPWRYAHQFKQILRDRGPYNIIHSHIHHFSGVTLRLAHQMNIPVRIAHSHNDTSPLAGQLSWPRKQYINLTHHWIHRYATLGLAASQEAAKDLFGENWQASPRWQLLYYGVDLSPFQEATDPVALRTALNIPADALVIGHVGRFEQQKNHRFLLKIAEELYRRDPRTYLLLIGEGPLRPEMEQIAVQSSMQDRIHFAGLRSDVPQLMLGAMDVFLLPSFHEGLPVVGIEAQAAGLPMVLSDTITPELDAVPGLVHRVSLQQPATHWAEVVLASRTGTDRSGMTVLNNSPFDIAYSVQQLEAVYRQSVQGQLTLNQA
jgi:glycosyltransferase involved in cell wall biosynthesis